MARTSAFHPSAIAMASRQSPGVVPVRSSTPGHDDVVLAWRRRRCRVSAGAIEAVDPAGIEIIKTTRQAAFFRLRRAGFDASDVIAACMPQQRGCIEQTIYEQLLPKLNVSTPRYYGSSVDDGSCVQWVFTQDAAGETYSPNDPECRVAAARWLAALHVGTARAEADLGDLGLPEHGELYYRDHLRTALDELKHVSNDPSIRPLLSHDDVGLLQFLLDACTVTANRWDEVRALTAAAPRTVIHGDAAPRNFQLRRDRSPITLLGFDWEDAAWAPPALDLIHADPEATCDAINPDLETYLAETRSQWPRLDRHGLRRSGEIGKLFWHLLAIRLDAEAMSIDSIERRFSNLRLYAQELLDVFGELEWPSPACHFDRGIRLGAAHE